MVGMDAAVVLAALAVAASPPVPAPTGPPAPKIPDGPAHTVGGAIRRAQLTGAISWTQRVAYEGEIKAAKRAARRLPALRSREVQGVLALTRASAARGELGAERLDTLMRAVHATRWTMTRRPFPLAAQRLMLPGDGIVYQFRPGSGVHPHPLATAGRLNGLADACLHERRAACRPAALARAADALADLGVRTRGELRLEYTFPFGHGRPPWTSSMAQATAAQALARAGRVTGEHRFAAAATGAYRALVRDGTAIRAGGRVERFSMYSFQPGTRVLNGELQTLVGLGDYARLSSSATARRVLRRTSRELAGRLGVWDTGAWTLYDTGGQEASLHYHVLASQFAARACAEHLSHAFCPAARRYARYTREPPRLSVAVDHHVRAGKRIAVAVRSSKLAGGAVAVRGPGRFRMRTALTLGRRSIVVRVPIRHEGRYRIVLSGTAVNGKAATTSTALRARPSLATLRARRRAAERRRRQERERRRRHARAVRRERQERERSERAREKDDRPAT